MYVRLGYFGGEILRASRYDANLLRCVRPPRAGDFGLRSHVDMTQLFSLRENAIVKEPGSSFFKPWRCVSRLGLMNVGLDSLESSPYVTLSRRAFSASSQVTPTR
jgi:hypothetical protein